MAALLAVGTAALLLLLRVPLAMVVQRLVMLMLTLVELMLLMVLVLMVLMIVVVLVVAKLEKLLLLRLCFASLVRLATPMVNWATVVSKVGRCRRREGSGP